MKITRRCGSSPRQRGSVTGQTCPDIFELEDGRYLVIGKIPDEPHLLDELGQHDASIGVDEFAVVLPADVMHDAARDVLSKAPDHDQ